MFPCLGVVNGDSGWEWRVASVLPEKEGVIYCFLKGDIWGQAEQEGGRERKGAAEWLRSTLNEHLVNKTDGLPQGAIRT